MSRRHHAFVILSAVVAMPLVIGCEEDEKATPQAIFEGRLEKGQTDCEDARELFRVGDFGNQEVEPKIPSRSVKDGDSEQQGGAGVVCGVTPAGPEEFDVNASINLTGATGGAFRLTGRFKTAREIQQGITASFSSRATGNAYEARGTCTVEYATQYQGVAAGRVWGVITCERVENATAQKTCKAIATFRFENCAQ
jgi:hypothetical protein